MLVGYRRVAVTVVVCALLSALAVAGIRRWQQIAAGPPVPSGWTSWALLDLRTGAITGSANLAVPSSTESMVKVWIAADDLRELAARHRAPDDDEIAALTVMIRDSDDRAAQTIYRRNGSDEVVHRLISICGLTETTVHPNWWSLTAMSARDAARMGQCVADGRAAGPLWTEWVLAQMRQVRGEGRFGIVSALPVAEAARLAIKNGWTLHQPGDEWSVNCLAISGDWVLAVEVRYPPALGSLAYGARVCATVARAQVREAR